MQEDSQAEEGVAEGVEQIESRSSNSSSSASSSSSLLHVTSGFTTQIGRKRPLPTGGAASAEAGSNEGTQPEPKRRRTGEEDLRPRPSSAPATCMMEVESATMDDRRPFSFHHRHLAPTAAGGGAEEEIPVTDDEPGLPLAPAMPLEVEEEEEEEEYQLVAASEEEIDKAIVDDDNDDDRKSSSSPCMTYTCPLCLCLLVRPVTLECGSSLCESCVAQTLERAWMVDRRRAAPCPVLGPSCPCGPVNRLPRVNALLHNDLRARYPSHYADRLVEVQEKSELVGRIQAKSARMARTGHRLWSMRANTAPRAVIAGRFLRGAGERQGGGQQHHQGGGRQEEDDEDDILSDEELRQPLAHMRFALPFLMAIVASSLLVPGRGPYSGLANNGFALLLSSCAGAHWWLWSYLGQSTLPISSSSIAAASISTATRRGETGGGVPLLLTLPPEALREMRKYRGLLSDFGLRIRIAGDFPPGLGFCCTWLLLARYVCIMRIDRYATVKKESDETTYSNHPSSLPPKTVFSI